MTQLPIVTLRDQLALDYDLLSSAADHIDNYEPEEAIHELMRVKTTVAVMIPGAVTVARVQGYTWEQIGLWLGMTKQAAQQRFSDAPQ